MLVTSTREKSIGTTNSSFSWSMGRSFSGELMGVASASYPIGMARLFACLLAVHRCCLPPGGSFFRCFAASVFLFRCRCRNFRRGGGHDKRLNQGVYTHE